MSALPAAARTRRARTVGGLRRAMAASLSEAFAARHYSGTPALDARVLLAQLLEIAPQEVPLRDDEPVGPAVWAAALDHAARRAAGEPVARIVGHKEFHGLDFALSADTLVPRPETETLVEAALEAIAPEAAVTIADLGTGSGAILVAVLAERPNAVGVGVDLSPGAVATAAKNARRLGVAGRAHFIVGDWLAAIGRADFILANPPYIASGDIPGLDVDVRTHDPLTALDGGADGLDAVRIIVNDLGRVLAPGGAAFIEIGAGQAPAVTGIARERGFDGRFACDLAGHQRVAVLRRA